MSDYNFLPHDEINRVKREITSGGSASADSVVKLTESMNSLLDIFKEAAQDMKMDEHDAVLLADKIDPLIQKIDRVLEQNEKIAKGIVAIADMVEEIKNSHNSSPPRPEYRQPAPQAPQFTPQMPGPPKPLPTNPVPEPKKESKFSLGFK